MAAKRRREPIREIRRLAINLLDDHPANVRDDLGDDDLMALADSIRTIGLLQPLVVAPKPDGRFEILAGHRRRAALLFAGEETAPCVVRPRLERGPALELMLAENLQRRTLNPIEEANAYQSLVNLGYTQVQIAEQTGVAQSQVSGRLALLELSEEEQEAIARKSMTLADAKEVVQDRRVFSGKARSDLGSNHKFGRSVPHFKAAHPLADRARVVCRGADHSPTLRLGPACGVCWEQIIREDERARLAPAKEQAS